MITLAIVTLGILTLICASWHKNEQQDERYYVFNPEAYKPTYIHRSLESAQKEAKRLSYLYPFCRFQVLKIVDEIAAYRLVGEDEIPF